MIDKVIDGLKHCSVMQNCGGCPYKSDGEVSKKCIDELQIDTLKVLTPVVRCKECKWYNKEQPGYETGTCAMHSMVFPKETFFCAYGVKKG